MEPVTLPLCEAPPRLDDARPSTEQSAGACRPAGDWAAPRPQRLKVLIVEDNDRDTEAIVRALERAGYAPDWARVDDAAAFQAQLQTEVDVILCEGGLPGFGGLEALRLLNDSGLPIPLIVVSHAQGEDAALNAIRNGAADFLRKDRLARLGKSIEHAIGQCRLRHEHRTMMEALRQAEARYRGIFENAIEGIFQATPEGRLLAANPALARILGYASPRETVGMVDDILGHLCSEASRRQQLRRQLEVDGLVTGFETQAVCWDGRRTWVTLNCRTVHSETAALLEGTVEDITERKNLESQLLRAQRLESVGRLASGIAHDLNNILMPIVISPGLLRERVADAESRELIDSIEVSARRGADIVRQLLAFGRGTDGERVPVQLRALMSEMLSIVRETFPKNINLRSALATTVRPVRGDPTQLHQVILNLCVNARDAMPHGGELLLGLTECEVDEAMVRANTGASPGPHVVLRVADTGVGIPAEHLDKIFDPFFTTKEVGQGTGLGLSTVLGIVSSHGGFIHLESVPARGTEFRVYLPVCPSLERNEPEAPAPTGPAGRGELILLVDDERVIRQATRTMLERHGYRVVEARDGEDALERIEQHGAEVAAVVADLLMPRMDGAELIRQLRRRPHGPVIVAMTGVGKSPKVVQVRELGVQVLQKPFPAETLLATLARLLRCDSGVAGNWGW